MATTTTTTAPETYRLELMSANGTVFRDVLRTPPRDCDRSEIPMIDLSHLRGTAEQRRALSQTFRDAAENTGFFYIKNHGIPRETVQAAFKQAQTFFTQPVELKSLVAQSKSKHFNGWAERHATRINPREARDRREGFTFRYNPRYDPETKDLDAIPEEVKPWLRGEEMVWDGTSHIPKFKEEMLEYWRSCLTLARDMIQIFAMALDCPEDYFNSVTSYPGSDGVFNYYPKNETQQESEMDPGLGAHTDLQCFTLLWQDNVGGLQVLTKEGQWVNVPPIEDTFVVNIGDYLMRLSNDRFKSTVHRVYSQATVDRYSMPFFFGFNFNEKCSVLPTCVDENNPPKYEPISCGEWCRLRISKTYEASKEN
ncbi:2OG-Fe(II) oxygenase superfamily protein [Stachybotrys elegans]|uniref:2OG-Fe(II) oxygenase superfamily protein n=1 Tax=Stachybotrys elegans TaxID=80388 RepID=A0A8K0WLI6_9HYPO|nr:2OG-Fe(II) oxygenase superfamily protein [Stachybotrys elegans]